MGLAPSKLEGDKVLVICQERKQFVREALDARRALAASHRAYMLSLRETAFLLRKCFETQVLQESALNVGRKRNSEKAIDEVSVPATVTTRSSFSAVREASQDFENAHDLRRLPEEEGTPELEEEGGNGPTNEDGDFVYSGDDFNNPSTETLVWMIKNRNGSHVGNTRSHSDERRVAGRSSVDILIMNGESEKHYPDVSTVVKDLNTCTKEVEILFFRACDSGKEVPRILEEDKIQFRPLLPEGKAHGSMSSSFLATLFACCREDATVPESPSQAEIKYTWHKLVSSQSSPSSLWTNAGSHISTLDRLYAWESKLHDEVKASSAICRRYHEKSKKLRHQEAKGANHIDIGLTRSSVKDLHSRVLVALQKIDFISKNIEELRDKDLQPQLDELIGCFTRMWATMLECHQRQCAIIKLLVSRRCSVEIPFYSESQRQAALLLLVELRTLCSNFKKWMASLKTYLCSINLWLHKCMKPLKMRKASRKRNAVIDVSLTGCPVAPIFTACEVWIKLLDDLPTRDLEEAIEGLIADTRHSIPHQEMVPNDGTGVKIRVSHGPAVLQSSLLSFLEKLEAFSKVSVQKYIDLQKNVSVAKETFGKRIEVVFANAYI